MPSLAARVWEQSRLLATSGIREGDYYHYGLYEPSLDFLTKASYIGTFELWRWIAPLSPPAYRELSEDKILFERYLAAAGVPTTRTLLAVSASDVPGGDVPVVDLDAFGAWLASGDRRDLFLKPRRGIRGRGVLSLGERAGTSLAWRRLPDGSSIPLEGILDHIAREVRRDVVLVQERLRPHPSLHAFAPEVTHCARIITFFRNGGPEIACAALKIGVGGHAADNLIRGHNVVAPIDLATGRLGPGVAIVDDRPVTTEHHPKTGALISGLELPDWSDLLEIVLGASRALYMNKVSGWDVALTEEGPKIVETNVIFDPLLVQVAHRKGLLAFDAFREFLRDNDVAGSIGLGRNPHLRGLRLAARKDAGDRAEASKP